MRRNLPGLRAVKTSCIDGCQTSFRYGNSPWGASAMRPPGQRCRQHAQKRGQSYKSYLECREAGLLVGSRPAEIFWYVQQPGDEIRLGKIAKNRIKEFTRPPRLATFSFGCRFFGSFGRDAIFRT